MIKALAEKDETEKLYALNVSGIFRGRWGWAGSNLSVDDGSPVSSTRQPANFVLRSEATAIPNVNLVTVSVNGSQNINCLLLKGNNAIP